MISHGVAVTAVNKPSQGGSAIPVREAQAGERVQGGAAIPVYLVPEVDLPNYRLSGEKPIPVTFVTDRPVVGGRAIPVYLEQVQNTYTDQVLTLLSSGMLAYWPMNETSGSAADNAEGAAARDGTFNGVTLDSVAFPNAGEVAGLWPGTSCAMNGYSASLSSVFDGQELTLGGWFKAFDADVWNDAVTRRFGHFNGSTGGDGIILQKQATGGSILIQYVAGGTAKNKFVSTTTADWFHLVITVSLSNDRYRVYFNGVQDGADIGALGTWTNSGLVTTETAVGASTGAGGTFPFHGSCYGFGIWNRELTAAEIGAWYGIAA